jgi:phospholipid/cholesterol/gamma-HCH transport system ATP-binding protein
MISIRNLYKAFGQQIVLNGISADIPSGTTTAVIGPSGTGKSVLLKIITGLMNADSGEVEIHGRSMTSAKDDDERREICGDMGVLFQAGALFDSMNLLDNVAFPLVHRRIFPEDETFDRSLKCLYDVGLQGYELKLPGEISIGMRKRVGIARALVTEPKTILFDEPNTGLDPLVGQEIYDLIKETQASRGFTGIVVSHEIPEVFQVCERVIMLYNGEVQINGTVGEFLNSRKPVISQFMHGNVDGPITMN